jgi:hypothetical protein
LHGNDVTCRTEENKEEFKITLFVISFQKRHLQKGKLLIILFLGIFNQQKE